MIESKDEFNDLLNRLKAKDKENKLGKSLQTKLQAFLEVEELINLPICGVSSSAFKDELIRKTESMIWFARENYNKEYYEGVLNAMRNLQVHIKKTYKKHYC